MFARAAAPLPLFPMIAVPLRLVAALVWLAGACAAANELGRPIVRHYTPGEHLRGTGSRRVVQDAAGFVYVANDTHLLAFDGARWSWLELPSASAGVRQFALTDDGTIYLAGAGVMGFLRGVGADAKFVSLADRLPEGASNIDELHGAVALGSAVYFSDAEKLLRWRDGRFTVFPYPSGADGPGARLHRVGDTLYVTAPGRPLVRFRGDALEPVADAPVFRERRTVALAAGADGALVALATEGGFFRVAPDGTVAPLPTEMNRWLAGKRVYCARRLADGSWVVGFSAVSGDGGMRFAPDGSYAGPLDTTIGLVVRTVRDFFEDREGGLWLGMDQGCARLEWPSRVSVFDSFNGLGQGAVQAVLRHEGVLHVATSEGYFRLTPADDTGRSARFERIARQSEVPAALRREREEGAAGTPVVPPAAAVPHFVRATIGAISVVHEEPGPQGPVFWIGGANGLARLEGPAAPPAATPFAVRLTAQHVGPDEELPVVHPAVTFSFVAPRQRPTSPVLYRTRLLGLESEWSAPSARRDRSFSQLPSGTYRFEVRATDAAGVESAPAILAFSVQAPWWRRPWALAGYVLVGGGLVAGLIQVRTRALRRRAEHLEGIVAERTEELARRNAELLRLHQLDLDEKIAARLAEEKARLEVLRYQLNPHFLFNTLASISSALPEGTGEARAMVDRLAHFCRLTLHRGDDREWTTLGTETALLRTYFEIERSRWGDLLDLHIAIDPGLEAEPLPHFLLLPLVENALKYGRATSPDRVGIRLAARRAAGGEGLVVVVANTGRWVQPAERRTVSTLGIGLENLRERLTRYYAKSHRLDIAERDGWVEVTLELFRPPSV